MNKHIVLCDKHDKCFSYLTHIEKAIRLKEAKEEAAKEIEAYKSQRESAFQEQLKKV